jgi:CheY-like chemotaxis protein
MTADILEHAFEPFFTTKEVGEGSGLGLSMVYGFARQSGGNVTIDSAPRRGTTVRLYLPASDVRHSAPAGDSVAPIQGGQSQMILLVEDNADLRELTETMLHGLGYRTLAVANAAEAEQILARDEPVDLLLTDVVLPGGTNGPELIAKARIRRPGLKALLVSGFPTDDIERQTSPAAGVPLLIKPFRKHQLADAVRCALAG